MLSIQTAALPTVKLPDPDGEGSEKWWPGVCRIKTLCLNEALAQICSALYHHTCIFLSNFRSGKVRESWTGGDVRKSQESISSDWKSLLQLHHCALFQHDLSPTQMQVHTWTLDLGIKNRACRPIINTWFFRIHKNCSPCRMKYLIISTSEDNQQQNTNQLCLVLP